MAARDVTLSELRRLEAQAAEADVAFEMDEEAFRGFYQRTARPLWAYLSHLTREPQLADDLLQEAYYRFLRARGPWASEAHRRAYLFRIATNLVRDDRRRARNADVALTEAHDRTAEESPDPVERSVLRTDVRQAMARLRPRDRALLWLAYAEGQPHVEIAEVLGVRTGSVKLLLFRARRKLAALLKGEPAGPTRGRR